MLYCTSHVSISFTLMHNEAGEFIENGEICLLVVNEDCEPFDISDDPNWIQADDGNNMDYDLIQP